VSDPQSPERAASLKALKPLDPPTVPFAIGGMIVWLIAWLIAYLVFRDDHPSWPSICIAGFLLGFPGLAIMIVHDRHRRERRNQNGASEPPNAPTPSDVG
jgi:hypothetical protein